LKKGWAWQNKNNKYYSSKKLKTEQKLHHKKVHQNLLKDLNLQTHLEQLPKS